MIRKLIVSDIEPVMEIWISTNLAAHNFIPEEYWRNNYEVVEKEYLPISESYIYEDNQTIKGFISVLNNSFIGGLFVEQGSQGQGIGKKLISHAKEKYAELELCVYADNQKAVDFYKHCGFVITGQQPNEDSGYMEYIMKWIKE